MYDDERHVILVTYFLKRKHLEFKFNKKKLTMRGKKLNNPALFPLIMQDDELQWKLSLSYTVEEDKFLLFINDIPFLALPFKADITSAGPMNIENGIIKLNDVKVHEGWAQWTPDTNELWYREAADLQPTTEIYLEDLACST